MGKKKANRSVPVQIAIGSAADMLCMLALTAIAAGLTLGGVIGQGSVRTAALCANALAVFLGGFLTAKRAVQRRLPIVLAGAGGYLALLLIGNLLLVRAAPADVPAVILPAVGAAVLAALLASRRPARKRRR